MAWEYQYEITLNMVHPTMDPNVITLRMPDIKPSQIVKAGEAAPDRARAPSRSVWQARLHDEAWLHSESHDFSDVLRKCLERVAPYGKLFKEIRQVGDAYLRIAYFSDTNHCVSVVPADLLRQCATVGLDLDLEFYAPD